VERFNYTFGKTYQPSFDAVPADLRYTLFGVDYVRLVGKQGGEMYVTRRGWDCIDSIMPGAWFVDDRFRKVGRALAGATGAVYRVPVAHPARNNFALVVKFSRAAQDIGATLLDSGGHLDHREQELIDQAQFLSPFEEFGNLSQLRAMAKSTIPTKHPLAIYSPPTRYLDWQLGRKSYMLWRMNRVLEQAQQHVPEHRRIKYDWERLYILLYRWIDGIDAEAAARQGLITWEQSTELGHESRHRMRELGWMVCDHKPRHVIIRQPQGGPGFLTRGGRIKWAIIDYELLVPIEAPQPAQAPVSQPAEQPHG
jgi:hypothetical protein